MGYYIDQRDCQFHIRKENFDAAAKAILGLVGKESISDESGRHFAWVDMSFTQKTDLVEILKCWRWEVYLRNDDIVGISFTGEKLGDDELLFNTIAPYVENDSYIEMSGEGNDIWKWTFNDGKLIVKYARIKWD